MISYFYTTWEKFSCKYFCNMDPRPYVTTVGGVFRSLRGCSFLLGSVWIHLYCVSITNSIVYPRRSYNHNFSCANHPVLLQENPSPTLNTPPKPPAPMFCLYIRCISHLNCLGAYISPRLDPSTSIIFISGQFLEELQILKKRKNEIVPTTFVILIASLVEIPKPFKKIP